MSKRKQPNLSQFGFTKQTKRSDDSAPATTSLPVIPSAPPPLKVAASDSTSTEDSETLAPETTAATCSGPGDHATPFNWTTKQWSEWRIRNTWLYSKNQKLGCTVCMEAKSLLLAERATGVHLSEEWMNGEVSSESQNNLRKKIYKHRDSLAHKRAVEISEMKEKDVLPNKVLEVNANLMQETATSFRSAYMVAKEKMAYRKLPAVMSLQKLNGANVGNVHKSDHACAEIIGHIASEMRAKFVSKIKELGSRISITIDESTVHGLAYMIIYVRCDMTGTGEVDNVFLDIVELSEGTDAESMYKSLRNSLRQAGLDDEFLGKNLICIATDGAAVLTGRVGGLVTKLKQDFPKVQSIHCLAHRLELAVKDSLKEVAGCNQFEFFISKLYALYNQSSKNARLLQEAATGLNMQILKIGQIFTIRWVASSFRTVKAVWNDYPALAHQFRTAIEDTSRCDTERQKFRGLHKLLTSTGFLADLACMKDVLRELQNLSLKLQRKQTSLVDASCHIQQTIDVLTAMKASGGKSTQKAEQRISTGLFKDVELSESRPKINRLHLKKRLPEPDLVQMLKPLDKRFWPQQHSARILYGETEVRALAKTLGEPAREAVEEFRDFKLQNRAPGKTLVKLQTASLTYLPSSAECERGFFAVNSTDSKYRNKLREQSLSSLLFVDLNGPPLEQFDPLPFVSSWIKAGHRPSTSWVTGRKAKTEDPRPLWSLLI
ncbi:E3 SUMO-protein ligase KIAA1586-like [Megalobrama amblycephala]|uniref:E3 SUMO-protein ligase KIAA1586-like n=1 Tax=Megalobrama amblycephala TaxID=75352 RepID=UPI002013FA71|nr:E3 SUMO-protein ligase KIAA1586-like [Megalobrama amblycephala]